MNPIPYPASDFAKAKFAVYLPLTARLRATIAAGSGIVGSPDADRITLDYEGAIYHQESLARFADRVYYAAGRHLVRYPTVARLSVKPADVRRIGTFDGNEGEVHLVRGEATALAAWLGVGHISRTELLATGSRYEKRRSIRAALASGNAVTIAKARAYAAREHFDDLA